MARVPTEKEILGRHKSCYDVINFNMYAHIEAKFNFSERPSTAVNDVVEITNLIFALARLLLVLRTRGGSFFVLSQGCLKF